MYLRYLLIFLFTSLFKNQDLLTDSLYIQKIRKFKSFDAQKKNQNTHMVCYGQLSQHVHVESPNPNFKPCMFSIQNFKVGATR